VGVSGRTPAFLTPNALERSTSSSHIPELGAPLGAAYLTFNPQGVGHHLRVVVLVRKLKSNSVGGRCPSCGAEMSGGPLGHERAGGRPQIWPRCARVLSADGDDFVVKRAEGVDVSGAHDADVLLTFCSHRSNRRPKHKGISALMIPTDLPRRPATAVRIGMRSR